MNPPVIALSAPSGYRSTVMFRPLPPIVFALIALCLCRAVDAWALHPVAVAPGVYAFLGSNAEAAPENGGFVGNSGFIVGERGVVVIDTGGSLAHGEAMLSAIAAVTDKPVETVIITHAIQDFVFGAAAFRDRGIPLLAHRGTTELMQARCEHCLQNLRGVLGEAPLTGTRLVIPEQVLEGEACLLAGGREIDIIPTGWASTPGDVLVFDRRTRTLFAGGIVTAARVPELRDGEHDGWLRALDRIVALDPLVIIPGYGPLAAPTDARRMTDYLLDLDVRMRALYEQGMGLSEAIEAAELPAYRAWALYPDQHRRNALRRYLQLEVEDLERQ